MRSMTEQEAEYYIKAGYFPKENDLEAICDLQDVYGHQRYWTNIKWLYMAETKHNAEKLFRLIWANDTVDSYIKEAQHITELYRERTEVAAQISELQQKLDKLNDKIDNINLKLHIQDENYPDYYDEWGID